MRILMLSWEFPPRSIGGLARHVYDLSSSLIDRGIEVYLITVNEGQLPEKEVINGVNVYRVSPYHGASLGFVSWVLHLNLSMLEKGTSLFLEYKNYDLIHAHDWLVAYAARGLKHAYKVPLLATIHATEYGRNQGVHNDVQRYISDIEWWLAFEAWRVICCSKYMKHELQEIFQVPDDKVDIIYNGVYPEAFEIDRLDPELRECFAFPDEQIVFYVGRLVQEKGVQVLLDAVPLVLEHYPRTKFIIAGRGPHEDALRYQCDRMGLGEKVMFTGYIDDKTRNSLYRWASAAVFPSLYEPFGIVALEAMAAGSPVVVANSGGLGEIVEHQENGLKSKAGDAFSLANEIKRCLGDPALVSRLREKAYEKIIRNYTWDEIARQTINVYRKILSDSETLEQWRRGINSTFSAHFSHEKLVRNPGRYEITS